MALLLVVFRPLASQASSSRGLETNSLEDGFDIKGKEDARPWCLGDISSCGGNMADCGEH